MKYCDKCRVKVVGERSVCPLCQGSLSDIEGKGEEVFPKIPTMYRRYNLFFRILIFVSVVVGVSAVAVNLMIPQSGSWAWFVVLGIGCMWIMLAVAVRKRSNKPHSIVNQVFMACVLAVLWDWLTGWHGWSLDYVIPVACSVGLLCLAIAAKVMNMDIRDYMVYLCVVCLFGAVPLVFYFAGWLDVVYPTVICAAGSVISFAALVLFQGENMKNELKRRLHL